MPSRNRRPWRVAFRLLALLSGAGILSGYGYQRRGQHRDRGRFPPPGRLISAGGERLHLHATGRGMPTVVFDAGIAASSLSWSRVQPEVSGWTRTCAYDRPGLAWSEWRGGGLTLDGMARTLRALLAAAGERPPFVVVGHSFGALVARAFAARYPGDVVGVVLVDPLDPAEWQDPPPDRLRMLKGGIFLSYVGAALAWVGLVRFLLVRLEARRTDAPRRFVRVLGPTTSGFLHRIVGEVQKLPASTWPAVRSHWSVPQAFVAMAAHLRALPSCCRGMGPEPPPPGIPLTILMSPSMRPESRRACERLAGESSRGRCVVARQSGHWIHLDEPALVLEAIREMVERARAERRHDQT